MEKRDINSNALNRILPMIKCTYESLTKSEKKAADVVLKEAEKIIYASITDFAEMAGVGDTTILRFCRKVGHKGYQSFKMTLAQELSMPSTDVIAQLDERICEDDSTDDLIQKTLAINNAALQETVSLLRAEDIDCAVDMMYKANMIHFYGAGSSGITAMDAKNKFMRIGMNVNAFMDAHTQAMAAALLNPDDVAVGISFSGSTKDTTNHLKLSKKSGAKTICITHHARSPITRHADVTLLIGAKESPLQGGAVSTKIAQLLVLDILYNAIFLKMKNEAVENKEKTSRAVLDKLY